MKDVPWIPNQKDGMLNTIEEVIKSSWNRYTILITKQVDPAFVFKQFLF